MRNTYQRTVDPIYFLKIETNRKQLTMLAKVNATNREMTAIFTPQRLRIVAWTS